MMKKKIAVLGSFVAATLFLSGCSQAANNGDVLDLETRNSNQEQNQEQNRQGTGSGVGSRNQNSNQNNSQERNGMGPEGGMGSSEEAIAACADKAEGDSCEFSFTDTNLGEERTLTGTCQNGPQTDDNETLSCRVQMQNGNGPQQPIQQ